MVIYALEKGVNVLCEKPLCIKEEDIGRIVEAESKSRATLGVCLQNRYNNSSRFVKQLLEGKKSILRSVTYLGIATKSIIARAHGAENSQPRAVV